MLKALKFKKVLSPLKAAAHELSAKTNKNPCFLMLKAYIFS